MSDSKVDMLFAQMPTPLRTRLAADLKLNLKVVSISLKENPSDENRFSKAGLVREYVRRSLPVGTIDEPQEYLQGDLAMRWGPLSDVPSVVFFGGVTEQTVLGLGGSMSHVIGAARSSTGELDSASPTLIAALARDAEIAGTLRADEWASQFVEHGQSHPDDVSTLVVAVTHSQCGPLERVEFLAKTLQVGTTDYSPTGHDRTVLTVLASPIYVAYSPGHTPVPPGRLVPGSADPRNAPEVS